MSFITLVSLLLASIGSSLANFTDQVGPRIVGGQPAEPGQFPFIVEIRLLPENVHQCGGSILNSLWVITAAHCVWEANANRPEKLLLVTGSVTPHQTGERRQPIQIIHHPEYNNEWYQRGYDMALLKLGTPFSRSTGIAAIRLGSVRPGEPMTVMGWGYGSAEHLKYASLVALRDCHNNPKLICGQSVDGSSCSGDSGGPLINNKGELVGIVSFGEREPCTHRVPTAFTKVESFVPFIQQVIGSY